MNNLKPSIMVQSSFLDANKASKILAHLLETVAWNKKMTSRYTASFGVAYKYSGMSYEELEMPESIKQIAIDIAKLVGYIPNNCLLNYYFDGNSKMGFHSDDTSQLTIGTGVAIISLGSERDMLFKHKKFVDVEKSYLLKNGSLMYMDDKVQKEWLHSIPKCDTTSKRISLTFRRLKTA